MGLELYPHDFFESLKLGISRCNSLGMLEGYYLRWRDEIEDSQRKEEVVQWFRDRKQELLKR